MPLLFSYGTLQLKNVQLELFGRLLNGTNETLIGYKMYDARIGDPKVLDLSKSEIHKIIGFSGVEEDVIEGVLYELTEAELEVADS